MAGVRYREIPPTARLRPFVESFWTLDCDHAGAGPPQRVVPDGHSELILNLGEPFEHFDDEGWHRQPRLFFAGQLRGPLLLRSHGRARILGVRFTPHGAARVIDAPMHELAGRFMSIDDFSMLLYRSLERALDSTDPLAAIEAALFRAAARCRRIDTAVTTAVEQISLSRGAVNLAELADDLNLSNRHLERRFNAAVGLPPKTFCQLRRFVEVFRVIGADDFRWVETAVACGYYDQAHLIRDFKRFSGETPAALLAPEADLARHFLSRFGMSHSSNTAIRRAV